MIVLAFSNLSSQNKNQSEKIKVDLDYSVIDSNACTTCDLPTSKVVGDAIDQYGLPNLILSNGRLIDNVTSINRMLYREYESTIEGLVVNFIRNGVCNDTLFNIDKVEKLIYYNVGSKGQPIVFPIRPSQFYFKEQIEKPMPFRYVDVSLGIGFTSGYENQNERNVGINTLYNTFEVLVHPFNSERIKISALLSGLYESGRLRAPVGMHLRYQLGDIISIDKEDNFTPSRCQFGVDGDPRISPNDTISSDNDKFELVNGNSKELDRTVYYSKEKVIVKEDIRPFFFIEGGPIIDIEHEGAFANPSLNPEEYSQYFIGGGIGLPISDIFNISLSYRYMRLNLRTPCVTCDNLYIVNTNTVNSVLLKFAYSHIW
jgi:hypothetical protein